MNTQLKTNTAEVIMNKKPTFPGREWLFLGAAAGVFTAHAYALHKATKKAKAGKKWEAFMDASIASLAAVQGIKAIVFVDDCIERAINQVAAEMEAEQNAAQEAEKAA